MKLNLIEFNSKSYPKFQSEGNAMQFALPYAKHICKGIGLDIGCNRTEWMYEGGLFSSNIEYIDFDYWLIDAKRTNCYAHSYPIDPAINEYDALHFPTNCRDLDYIISSHCLEHLQDWVDVLDYWYDNLAVDGILFLYLPDYSQEYWKPWNNRKHKNIFHPQIIEDYMIHKGFINIYKSGIDLNNSFIIFGQKS